MKWIRPNNDTSNFDDRRGRISKGGAIGGIGGIVVVLLALFLGKDPGSLSNIVNSVTGAAGGTQQEMVDESRMHEHEDWKNLTLNVFNSCNDVWSEIFQNELGRTYNKPTLVVYTDRTQSGCGGADAQMGPFYCSADRKVYMDMSFFQVLNERFRASGDLAMAYVTAHEMGHHVQYELGVLEQFHAMRGQISETEYNEMSVRVELQADFYAGLWAHYANKMGIIQLEEGDLEDALTAANAIGDDTLQKAAGRAVVPDSFTHGTSEQRMRWFKKGYLYGRFGDGDTFNARSL